MIPIHPIVDHFTIALFTLTVLFEIFAWLLKNDTLKQVAWWNMFFATLAALASYMTGLLIAGLEPHPPTAIRAVATHEALGLATMGLIVILFLWRTSVGDNFLERYKGIYLLVAFVALAALFFTGLTGGRLVYDHGVGVKPVLEDVFKVEPGQTAPVMDQTYEPSLNDESDSTLVGDETSE